jgi:hypothetical protein
MINFESSSVATDISNNNGFNLQEVWGKSNNIIMQQQRPI